VSTGLNAASCLWDVPPAPRDHHGPTLLLLPHAGGSAQSFVGWRASFPESVRLIAVQYPGRASRQREPYAADLGELTDELREALSGVEGPLYVFGHSLGAYVGFELCWTLQCIGRAPAAFFPSAAVPPHQFRPRSLPSQDLSDEEMLEALKKFEGLPSRITKHPYFLRRILQTCRSDVALLQNYSYGQESRRLQIPIITSGGERDRVVPADMLDGWRELSTADSEVNIFPGGHFYHIEDVAPVADRILKHL
jgi:surfactin synthase thioesterase subunit